jgi:hypothetical protein
LETPFSLIDAATAGQAAVVPEPAVRYAAERLVDDLASLYRHVPTERGVKL